MVFLIFVYIITVLLIILAKAYKNTKEVIINQVEIPIKAEEVEERATTFQILHISDLHLENLSITPDEMYDHLKGRSVDLIALTGDFLDRKRSIPKLVPYLEVFRSLQPTHGMYGVFGNHDYVLKGHHFQMLEDTLQKHDCHILKNEHASIRVNGQIVNIVGVDDYSTNRSDIDASFSGVENNGVNVVLTHDPNVVLEMQHVEYAYLLSGHFHGGQIHWPKPYHLVKMGKLAQMNMIKGLHKHEGKPFYISEGLGQTGVNIRLGSRPEITFHQLFI